MNKMIGKIPDKEMLDNMTTEDRRLGVQLFEENLREYGGLVTGWVTKDTRFMYAELNNIFAWKGLSP